MNELPVLSSPEGMFADHADVVVLIPSTACIHGTKYRVRFFAGINMIKTTCFSQAACHFDLVVSGNHSTCSRNEYFTT